MTRTGAAALSLHPIAATATGEVTGAVLEALGPGPDAVHLFASHHHTGTLEDVVGAVRSILGPGSLTTETSDAVVCGTQVVDDGPALALLAVRGPVHVVELEVPGCRPIGQPMVVTSADGDLLTDLASEPALAVLRRLIDGLAPADRNLAARGLHLGVVLDERQDDLGPGDFAVHEVRGSVGGRSLAVGTEVPVGTTVQFLVADPATARTELRRAVRGRGAVAAVLRTSPDRPAVKADATLLATLTGGAVAGIAAPGEAAAASVLLFETPG